MRTRVLFGVVGVLATLSVGLHALSPFQQSATITLNPAVQYQTITTGWMAAAQTGELKETIPRGEAPLWASYSDGLLNDAVNTLGLTCISMGVRSGQESSTDRWAQYMAGTGPNVDFDVINDNSSPTSANASGFHWGFTDFRAARTIAKFRAAMIASGQTPCIKAGYVDFEASTTTGFKHSTDTAEYGEFFLQFFNHMQATFGWVPTELDIVTEPTNGSFWWTTTALGNAIVSVRSRLAAAGYHPRIIAPSYVGSDSFYVTNIATILGLTGVNAALDEVGYHLYSGNNDTQRAAVLSAAGGKSTNMTELIGGDQTTIMADLTVANASGWMANSLAFPDASDDGGNYYTLNGTTGAYALASRARYLRHFFHYIRPGAVRIAAASAQGALTPVAFVNTGGRSVVVANATSAQAFTVGPLPAGTYGIRYTTATATHVNAGDQTIGAGGTITTSIPGAGTITIFDTGTGTPAPPGAFGKSSPANGATGQSTSLTLSWGASTGATAYAYCYDTTNDGACSAWTSTSTSTSAAISGLAANTPYYWQARAANASGTTYADGGSTAFWGVTAAGTAPGAFAKSSPASGATAQATSLTLSWGASAGATSYEYCYDATNDGSCGAWTSSGASTSAGISGLTANTTYYWQARATSASGTTYADGTSAAFRGFTTTVAAPSAFGKSSPASGATDQAMSLTLSWGTSAGATSYEYCYDATNDGSCGAWTSSGASTSAGISGLINSTTYYWQVRATNAGSTIYADGASTAFQSFTTQGSAPGAFGKISPAAGALGQPTSVNLTWSASAGVNTYDYCLDTTNDNACASWVNVPATTSVAIGGLAANTIYYWHVRARNETGFTYADGAATAFQNFSTASAPCSFSLGSITSGTLPATATGGTVTVTTASSCVWSAATSQTWIQTTSNGTGDGTVTYTVNPNTGAARSGTIVIAGLNFTVAQAAATVCKFTLGATSSSTLPNTATSGSVAITTGSSCAWTATTNRSWIHTSSSGVGTGTVTYAVDANPDSARSGTLTVGGRNFTVKQAAARRRRASKSSSGSTAGATATTGSSATASIKSDETITAGQPGDAPQNADVTDPVWNFTTDADGQALAWTKMIDLRDTVDGHLRFRSRLLSRASTASVQISTDGRTWLMLTTVPASDGWVLIDVDLSAFAGQIIWFRFALDVVEPAEPGDPPDLWWITPDARPRPPVAREPGISK